MYITVPKKTVEVLIRVSPEQREEWKSAAAAEDIPLSEWIRKTLSRGGGMVDLRPDEGRVPRAVRGPVERAGSNPAPATKKQMPDGMSASQTQRWLREHR